MPDNKINLKIGGYFTIPENSIGSGTFVPINLNELKGIPVGTLSGTLSSKSQSFQPILGSITISQPSSESKEIVAIFSPALVSNAKGSI